MLFANIVISFNIDHRNRWISQKSIHIIEFVLSLKNWEKDHYVFMCAMFKLDIQNSKNLNYLKDQSL